MKQQLETYIVTIRAAIKAAHKANKEPMQLDILPLMPRRSAYYKPVK